MKDIIIVGTGKAGFLHYYSYKKFEKIGRIYFVDIDGKIKNENIKDSKVYSSIESTIKKEKLDVNNIIVDICTPKSVFLDIIKSMNIVPVAANLFMGIVMMIIGIIISAIATVLYLGAGLGSGPRDGLMLALNKKFSKPVGAIRICIELTVLVCGWILGGSVGLGTIISAFGLGYAIQIGFKICRINSKEIKHRIIRDDIDYIKNIIEQRKNLQANKEYITKDCNDNK